MKVLVLGSGYTGSRLAQQGRSLQHTVWESHRQGPELIFDLQKVETWKNLPQVDLTFWTFSCEPPEIVSDFLSHTRSRLGKVVAIGTLSSFVVTDRDQEISEDSALYVSDPRVQGEQILLSHGGILVRAAGIYGPQRSPLNWIQKGAVSRSDKFVNFIHLDDLTQILWAAAERAQPGTSWIAADGKPHRWKDLIDQWQRDYSLQIPTDAAPSKRASKRANSSKTLKELDVRLKFPDVFAGVRAIHD